MNRLLDLAESLCGSRARRDVFEPMLADRDREIAAAGSRAFVLRSRWAIAIALTFVVCGARGLSARVPTSVWLDLGLRAVAFSGLAFVSLRVFDAHDASIVPQSWLATVAFALPYSVLPVVARIRTAAFPLLSPRRQAAGFVALVAIAIALVADGDWGFRVALAAAAPLLGLAGWRLSDPSPEYERISPPPWIKTMMIAAVLTLSTWPAKLALGLNQQSPYWDGDQLVAYGMAAFVVLTMSPRPQAPVS